MVGGALEGMSGGDPSLRDTSLPKPPVRGHSSLGNAFISRASKTCASAQNDVRQGSEIRESSRQSPYLVRCSDLVNVFSVRKKDLSCSAWSGGFQADRIS